MKLREIDKSEIFDLIKQRREIYHAVRVNPEMTSLQAIIVAQSLYVEDDRPDGVQAEKREQK